MNCEDTRPQNQLSTLQEQQKSLQTILQGASVTLHTIFLSVGGTNCNNHSLEPFKELGLDSQNSLCFPRQELMMCLIYKSEQQ
jgi:hypothetical protein